MHPWRYHRASSLGYPPFPYVMQEENLGINATDMAHLCAKLHVIVHAAATINFNDPLRCVSVTVRVILNVFAVRRFRRTWWPRSRY